MFSNYHRVRGLLLIGVILSAVIFNFACNSFGIPFFRGFGGSILREPSPILVLMILGITLLVTTLLSTLVTSTVRYDAGLFCALVGMSWVSHRSGTMGGVLRTLDPFTTTSVFISFALELVAIYAVILLVAYAIWVLNGKGWIKPDSVRDGVDEGDEPLIHKISAVAMQACVMVLVILIMGQTDFKMQSLMSVGVASFVGACVAYYMYAVSPGVWLWIGPLFAGVAGYLLAYFNINARDELWRTGQFSFTLAPLVRSLPMDYATAGPVGAILGYWMSRKWHAERLVHAVTEAAGKSTTQHSETAASIANR